jgi:hypothetical protein
MVGDDWKLVVQKTLHKKSLPVHTLCSYGLKGLSLKADHNFLSQNQNALQPRNLTLQFTQKLEVESGELRAVISDISLFYPSQVGLFRAFGKTSMITSPNDLSACHAR